MKTTRVIIVGVIVLVLLSVVALVVPVGIDTSSRIFSGMEDVVNSEGRIVAQEIGDRFTEKFVVGRNLVGVVGEMVSREGGFSFDDIDNLTSAYLNNDPDPATAGYWTIFETSALTDDDMQGAEQKWGKKNTQLNSYTYRDKDKNVVDTKFVDDRKSVYYASAFNSEKPFITDPYNFEGVNMVSFCFPIRKNGKVIGVGGFDLVIAEVDDIINNVKIDGEGVARLVTNRSKIVASAFAKVDGGEDEDLASQKPFQEAMSKIQRGEQQAGLVVSPVNGEKDYMIAMPVYIGNSGAPWMLEIKLPYAVMQKKVEEALFSVIVIAIIVLVIAVIVAVIFSIYVGRAIDSRDHWYKQILDTISAPISIVNMNMESQYLNKAARVALKVEDESYAGKACCDIWNLGICDSSKGECPLYNLNVKDENRLTTLQAFGDTWDIHSDFVLDIKGNKLGMVEYLEKITARARIEGIVANVTGMVQGTKESSEQINAAAQSLSQGATEQAASLEEISASINEASSQVSVNADNAIEANSIAKNANEVAAAGSEKMQGLESSMQLITDNANLTRNVIKTIDDIAFQTNLLALNAAVEAARAGVHGKGFAVVAEEVRNLAARSAKAAQETADLIDKSNSEVAKGAQLTQETAKTLTEIAEESQKVETLIGEIACASKEQAQGIEQINIGLEQIDKVTQQNTATAEQTASAATELNEQINSLVSELGISSSSTTANTHSRRGNPNHSAVKKTKTLPNTGGAWGGDVVAPTDKIILDDSEFGKF